MLSKQGWRLLCRPNSLVGRLFRARYYHQGDFLNAELGPNPSFVWRSIWETKALVGRGARWRVGDGSSINICGEPWLLDAQYPFVSTHIPWLQDKQVSSLMVPGSCCWDDELIHDIFNERDAELIRKISLNVERTRDTRFWALEKSGLFTVKSAYRSLQSEGDDDPESHLDLWKHLWKLKIPLKVKDLLWRAASKCLPTKVNLRLRHVPVDGLCPRCSVEPETTLHCLVGCAFAQSCWRYACFQVDDHTHSTFASWLGHFFKQQEEDARLLGAMICYTVWRARNDVVWNQKYVSASSVIWNAKQMLKN